MSRYDFAPGRASLLANFAGAHGGLAPLAFTGHLDIVPLGARAWSRDPSGEVRDGRLYGRGAADMKGGVAAFVAACLAAVAASRPRRGLTLC